jgi:hypothetical protein
MIDSTNDNDKTNASRRNDCDSNISNSKNNHHHQHYHYATQNEEWIVQYRRLHDEHIASLVQKMMMGVNTDAVPDVVTKKKKELEGNNDVHDDDDDNDDENNTIVIIDDNRNINIGTDTAGIDGNHKNSNNQRSTHHINNNDSNHDTNEGNHHRDEAGHLQAMLMTVRAGRLANLHCAMMTTTTTMDCDDDHDATEDDGCDNRNNTNTNYNNNNETTVNNKASIEQLYLFTQREMDMDVCESSTARLGSGQSPTQSQPHLQCLERLAFSSQSSSQKQSQSPFTIIPEALCSDIDIDEFFMEYPECSRNNHDRNYSSFGSDNEDDDDEHDHEEKGDCDDNNDDDDDDDDRVNTHVNDQQRTNGYKSSLSSVGAEAITSPSSLSVQLLKQTTTTKRKKKTEMELKQYRSGSNKKGDKGCRPIVVAENFDPTVTNIADNNQTSNNTKNRQNQQQQQSIQAAYDNNNVQAEMEEVEEVTIMGSINPYMKGQPQQQRQQQEQQFQQQQQNRNNSTTKQTHFPPSSSSYDNNNKNENVSNNNDTNNNKNSTTRHHSAAWVDYRNQHNPFQTAREVAVAQQQQQHHHQQPPHHHQPQQQHSFQYGGQNNSGWGHQQQQSSEWMEDRTGNNINNNDNNHANGLGGGGGPCIPESLKRKFVPPKKGNSSNSGCEVCIPQDGMSLHVYVPCGLQTVFLGREPLLLQRLHIPLRLFCLIFSERICLYLFLPKHLQSCYIEDYRNHRIRITTK